jgi:hypothetical protein
MNRRKCLFGGSVKVGEMVIFSSKQSQLLSGNDFTVFSGLHAGHTFGFIKGVEVTPVACKCADCKAFKPRK